MNASAASGENFDVRLTRPVFGAEAVVVTTAELLLLRIAVTADKDCIDGCCGVEHSEKDRVVCKELDEDCGGNFAIVTIEVRVAEEESLLPIDRSRWCC